MRYGALKKVKNKVKEALKMRVTCANARPARWPAAAALLMGRGITATSGQIWARNRARFNDWLLKVKFYRTTARTAREGQKHGNGEVARRGGK